VFDEAPKMPVTGEPAGKQAWSEFEDIRLLQAKATADFRDTVKQRFSAS
jgi:hypothetical protein